MAGRRSMVIVGVVIGAVVLLIVAFAVADRLGGEHDYGKPFPAFPSLQSEPNPTFHGTVAYIGDPVMTPGSEDGRTEPSKNNCARIVAASGGMSRDVLCWPMPVGELASLTWTTDGRLRVTVFDRGDGKETPTPVWGRVVDVDSGDIEVVPTDALSIDAFPPKGPEASPDGDRVTSRGSYGSLTLELEDVAGTTTRLWSVSDANPSFGIVSGPEWSSDHRWVLIYDGQRLLTTQIDEPHGPWILADHVSGAISDFGSPAFAITTASHRGSPSID